MNSSREIAHAISGSSGGRIVGRSSCERGPATEKIPAIRREMEFVSQTCTEVAAWIGGHDGAQAASVG